MASAVHSSSSADAVPHNARLSKEINVLPVPSTTPAARKENAASQKLAMILQYLNPLFYARIAQSFIYSVLESYRGTGTASLNAPRLTAGQMDPEFGAENTHSETANYDIPDLTAVEINDQFTTVAPEFEYLPHLNLSMATGSALITQSTLMGGSHQAVASEQEVIAKSTTADKEPQPEISTNNEPVSPVKVPLAKSGDSQDDMPDATTENKDIENSTPDKDFREAKQDTTSDTKSQ
ncbi:hypothetical protein J3B02_001742 [Coemansia erecta]|nr:hypothetical protein J3B02_001742 [Coemansia erecta]